MTAKHDGWKHNFGTTTLEDFNKKFFSFDKFRFYTFITHYFDKKIIVQNIRPDTNAEITIKDVSCQGNYNGYEVKIVHKVNGEITREWFPFYGYLKTEVKVDYTPHVCLHCGADWWCHGATPESIKYMIERITKYIELYS